MTTRKNELVESIIGYLLEHGLSELSLRPLAAATGTSARLLIYHFGSKEGLLGEVLETMQARLRSSLSKFMRKLPEDDSTTAPIRKFWDWATAKKNFPYLGLLYELQLLAARNPDVYGPYLQRNAVDWLQTVLAGMPHTRRNTGFATLCCAVFDGLFLELMSTGNRRRTTQALDEFIRIARNDLASERHA